MTKWAERRRAGGRCRPRCGGTLALVGRPHGGLLRDGRGGLLAKVSGALLAGLLGGAAAAEEPAPDPAFLEYLGSWEESDADWLLFEDGAAAAEQEDEKRSEPVPEGEASPESQDEHEISH